MCVFAVASCSGSGSLYDPTDVKKIDTDLGLSREDYESVMRPPGEADKNAEARPKAPPIPEVAPIIAAPRPPKLGTTKLVSVAVTDDVPLKDVLIELSRLADVDIEIDAGIRGGISFRAKERPFNEVIERIADLAGLRYTMKNGVLRMERDTPYIEIYSLDFLNIDRSTQSSVNVSTNVLSSSGGDGASTGLNTGSSASITSKADSDFWKQFEGSLQQILAYTPVSRLSGGDGGISSVNPGTGMPAQAPAEGTPTAPTGAVTINSGGGSTFYILNRQASTLTVSGSERQHQLMKVFLKKLEANASAQVLIEAKIVEVTLNRGFESGIDWSKLGGSRINFTSTFGSIANQANAATFDFDKQNFTSKRIDLEYAVQLAETFGTTRTLSSPRLHAINNQQAVLTFAENYVYFQLTVEREENTSTTGTSSNLLTVNSEIKTVPIGIILTLQPSINMETDEVTLNVRPTLSRLVRTEPDPAVAFLIAQASSDGADVSSVESEIPVVEVRELDSILKVRSGQVMVIGGLMENVTSNEDKGLPGASTVPILGNLFKATDRTSNVKELVIFIRATILGTHGDADAADKRFYKTFTNDPRPLDF